MVACSIAGFESPRFLYLRSSLDFDENFLNWIFGPHIFLKTTPGIRIIYVIAPSPFTILKNIIILNRKSPALF